MQEGGGELDRFVVSNLVVEITGPASLEPTIAATKVNTNFNLPRKHACCSPAACCFQRCPSHRPETQIGARVSYTARKSGTYNVSIKYFGDELPGSPLPVVILAGRTLAQTRPCTSS